MKKQNLSKSLIILLIFSALFSCQQKPADESVVRSQKYKNSLLESYKKVGLFCTANLVPGMTVAVSIDNQLVWADGFGYSNYELKVKASPRHKFRIGQISELLTALTAAKLTEDGKLQIDKPVAEYLPEMSQKSSDFTIRQLAAHVAGIRAEINQAGTDNNNSLDKTVLSFLNDDLEYQPGAYFSQTEFGFDLIAYIIEKTTNNKFNKVQKAIFLDTLKLSSTVPDFPTQIIDQKSSTYDIDFISQPIVAKQIDLRGKDASAGYLSSVLDLVKVGNTLLSPGYFKQETLDLITTPYKMIDGSNSQYGFGLFIFKDNQNRIVYGQRGSVVGGHATLLIYPEDKIVIAMLANLSNSSLELPIFDVANIFLSQLHPELKDKSEPVSK